MSKFKLPSPQTTNFWVTLGYGFAVAAVCAVVIGAGTFAYLSEVQWTSFEYWGSSSVSDSKDFKPVPRSTVFRDVGGAALAVIGLFLLSWRSIVFHRQLKLSERGQFAERYQKAADMLGDEKQSVREAGIFALTELAKADPKTHYLPVQKLLCAFIREQSAQQESEIIRDVYLPKGMGVKRFSTDPESDTIEAIINFIELYRKFGNSIDEKWRPNFSNANLKRAIFSGLDLSNFNFSGCDLRAAGFVDCTGKFAFFYRANLCNANFSGSKFCYATLSRAYARYANFKNTKFDKAGIANGFFFKCNFEGTEFTKRSLGQPTFVSCDLSKAIIDSSDFKRCHLIDCQVNDMQTKEWADEDHETLTVVNANGHYLRGKERPELVFDEIPF